MARLNLLVMHFMHLENNIGGLAVNTVASYADDLRLKWQAIKTVL